MLAFTATLSGAGVTMSNAAALFGLYNGTITTILREGDLVDVDPNPLVTDNRTVSTFGLLTGAGGSDGWPNPLNASGLLVFRVSFTNGDTAILTAPVPEPSNLALCALAGFGILGCRIFQRNGQKG